MPTAVTRTSLPDKSRLRDRVGHGDFLDCYTVPARVSPRDAAQVITSFPAWARFLLVIRRVLTVPFGLINDAPETGDMVGIFPVESEHDGELIAGFDDRHLDFRVAVLSDGACVHLATWVHPHNFGGRLYLAAILPFHILIVRNALARVAAHKPVAA